MFLPYQGVLDPVGAGCCRRMGLYGSIVGVIFVHCIFGIPISTLMFRGYFAGIPNELIDAAKIDGCGFFSIYRWILLPISFPAFAVVLIWQFTSIWNDYLIGLIIVEQPAARRRSTWRSRTLPAPTPPSGRCRCRAR